MPITFDHNFNLKISLSPEMERLVNIISDKLASIDSKVDTLGAVVTELNAKVEEAPTAEDIALLESIPNKLDAIIASATALTPPPAA